jgi:hypothetical protein
MPEEVSSGNGNGGTTGMIAVILLPAAPIAVWCFALRQSERLTFAYILAGFIAVGTAALCNQFVHLSRVPDETMWCLGRYSVDAVRTFDLDLHTTIIPHLKTKVKCLKT